MWLSMDSCTVGIFQAGHFSFVETQAVLAQQEMGPNGRREANSSPVTSAGYWTNPSSLCASPIYFGG